MKERSEDMIKYGDNVYSEIEDLPPRREEISKYMKDLTGQRFGKLVCLYPTIKKSNDGSIYWACKCDCGNYCLRVSSNFRATYKTCHCSNPIHAKEDAIPHKEKYRNELNGRVFGNLKVVEFDHIKGKKLYLKCECLNCGNYCIVRKDNLTRGKTISCGCIKSKGEEKIAIFLRDRDIENKREFVFQNLRGDGRTPLRFDFYLPDKNCCIEFQGRQHFSPEKGWGGEERFKKQQIYDKRKVDYCQKNNIKLYIIRFDEDIEERLEDIYNELYC